VYSAVRFFVAAILWLGSVSAVSFADPGSSDPPSDPIAAGPSWSLELAPGLSRSRFSSAPEVGETAAVGTYLRSSLADAWSGEVVESATIVLDHKTPQVGYLGLALRHIVQNADPWIGPDGSLSFQRLASGLAFATDGNTIHFGLAAELGVGYLMWGPSGVSVHLSAYMFDATSLQNGTIVILGASYVVSPVRYAPRRPFVPPKPKRPNSCPYVAEYQSALNAARTAYSETCSSAASSDCERLSATVLLLLQNLNACLLGQEVGAPPRDDSR
jgi:hypothetical protein